MCEAVGLGAGFDDRSVEGEAVDDRRAEAGVGEGVDPASERLGRQRRVIERTMPWLTSYRRLSHRYERKPGTCLAFLDRQLSSAATNGSSN